VLLTDAPKAERKHRSLKQYAREEGRGLTKNLSSPERGGNNGGEKQGDGETVGKITKVSRTGRQKKKCAERADWEVILVFAQRGNNKAGERKK